MAKNKNNNIVAKHLPEHVIREYCKEEVDICNKKQKKARKIVEKHLKYCEACKMTLFFYSL